TNTVIVSGFGMRKHPMGGAIRFHRGIDLKADRNTPVRAVMDGVVVEAGWQGALGRCIKIKHSGGFETVYAHNNSIKVRKGERIKQGQVIGLSGNTGRSTGPHLHFEVIKNGKHVNPVQYLPRIRSSS
ncbi:MAG: M23 family metallopeptidase, partial [Candidatus Hinthialibacter sp.]